MISTVAPIVAGGVAAGALLTKAHSRLQLSRAKHPSLAGHARWSRRIAGLIPFYAYDEARFFNCDNAPAAVVERRRQGFARLSQLYHERFPQTAALTAQAREGISDLQFTSAYRVPFQFSQRVREALPSGSFVQSAQGVTITDLDGNT